MFPKDRITKLYWFSIGLWVSFPRILFLWVATEDILAGSLKTTATVLVAFTVPDIFSKAVASPWIVKRISFLSAFIVYSVLLVSIQVVFVFVNIVNVRLAGLCVLGLANGLGTITTAKLLGFFHECTGVYQSGYNTAAAFASISYTGLTTWACISPRITIAILTPLSLLPLLIYALLDKKRLDANKNTTKHIPLGNEESNIPPVTHSVNKSERPGVGWHIKHLFNEFYACYIIGMKVFLIKISFVSILSTVTFKSSPFPPRDHFQYYGLLSDLGIMVGGMELSLVSFFCPGLMDTIKIRRIWILVLLLVCHTLVFLSVSWFHYIDNVYIIFMLCFTLGVAAGCASVHCYTLVADLFPDSRKLGKVLGYIEVSTSIGRLSGALLGIFVETYLREHCEHRLLLGSYCLARLPSSEMWSTSACIR